MTYTVQVSDSLTGNSWTPATTVISQTDPILPKDGQWEKNAYVYHYKTRTVTLPVNER